MPKTPQNINNQSKLTIRVTWTSKKTNTIPQKSNPQTTTSKIQAQQWTTTKADTNSNLPSWVFKKQTPHANQMKCSHLVYKKPKSSTPWKTTQQTGACPANPSSNLCSIAWFRITKVIEYKKVPFPMIGTAWWISTNAVKTPKVAN